MSVILSSTTDKIEVVTTGATVDCDYETFYAIADASSPPMTPKGADNKVGNIAAGAPTTTDISGSPASGERWSVWFKLRNKHASASFAVVVRVVKSGGTARELVGVTLFAGWTLTLTKESAFLVQDASGGIVAASGLVTRQTLTSGSAATYTTPLGCIAIDVECIGGGGAGGSTANTASNIAMAGGGGSGGYTRKLIPSPAATYTYTVGAGGTPGAAGNNAGGNGGDTTFSTLTAKGGTGGPGSAAGTTAAVNLGGAGGVAGSGGDINMTGQPGRTAQRASGTTGGLSGAGAMSVLGGGAQALSAEAAGNAAVANTGGGGGGALSTGTSTRQGGAGGSGIIIVTEYY